MTMRGGPSIRFAPALATAVACAPQHFAATSPDPVSSSSPSHGVALTPDRLALDPAHAPATSNAATFDTAPPRANGPRRFDWSLDLRAAAVLPAGSVSVVGAGQLTDVAVGRWVGPFRFSGGTGLGVASCPTCQLDEDGLFLLPLRATVGVLPIEAGRLAIEIAGGYDVMGAQAIDGTSAHLLHGPEATVSAFLVAPSRATGDGGARERRTGAQLGVSRWYGPDGDAQFVLTGAIIGGLGL